MPNTFDHIETLIARALDNNLSPEEQATLQAWLEEDATNQRYYNELQHTWKLTGTADTTFTPDTDRNWDRFRQHMQTPQQKPRTLIRNYYNAFRIAAALLVLAGATTLYFVFLHGPQTVTVLTATREKKEVTLPDGSRIFLNQNSSLRYAKNLTGAERAIYLEGEAYFDVAQQEARPFVVYASNTQTQVLGTTFDIKAYEAQPVEIAVLSGKVAVSHKSNNNKEQASRLVVTSGRKAIFTGRLQLEEIAIADPNLMAWKENRLQFRDMRLRDVIRTLEAYYDVEILIEDSAVANYTYQGNFDAPQLEDVLNVIAAAADLSWTKDQGKYKLIRK